MPKHTQKEVDAEIKLLKEYRPKIPLQTYFGDANAPVIDAEIRALSELMTEDEAYEEFPTEEGAEENRELNGALDAIHWRDGDEKEAPSEGWKPLLEK